MSTYKELCSSRSDFRIFRNNLPLKVVLVSSIQMTLCSRSDVKTTSRRYCIPRMSDEIMLVSSDTTKSDINICKRVQSESISGSSIKVCITRTFMGPWLSKEKVDERLLF